MSGKKIIQGLEEAVEYVKDSKPSWCPQDVWDAAEEYADVLHSPKNYMHRESREVITRAILAAKAEELEFAKPVIEWADRQKRVPYSVATRLDQIRKRGEA